MLNKAEIRQAMENDYNHFLATGGQVVELAPQAGDLKPHERTRRRKFTPQSALVEKRELKKIAREMEIDILGIL